MKIKYLETNTKRFIQAFNEDEILPTMIYKAI